MNEKVIGQLVSKKLNGWDTIKSHLQKTRPAHHLKMKKCSTYETFSIE